ncbi:MAG TPA: hypothetical protein VJA94_13030 [Candidatus Angelobacter sp.]
MKSKLIIGLMFFLLAMANAADVPRSKVNDALAELFLKLDLQAAKKEAELVLLRNPHDSVALFVRMEVAELETDTNVVLDSALRLCRAQAPENVSRIASARILHLAGNTPAFRAIIPRIQAAARRENACSSDLKLALVTAAADGESSLDLAEAAASAGLLTRWQVAGPFGHYSNADFDRQWPPETDRFSRAFYGKLQTEEFLFPDGFVTLPDYFSAPGIMYAASDLESSRTEHSVLEISSPGPYTVFFDGKPLFTHDSRYLATSARESRELEFGPGKHRVMVKFTADAAPFRVTIHPERRDIALQRLHSAGAMNDQTGQTQARKRLSQPEFPTSLNHYIEGLTTWFNGDLLALQRIMETDSSRISEYLRALLYSATEDSPSTAPTAWQSLLPAALAQMKMAESDASHKIVDLARALPDSEAVQQAAFDSSPDESSLERLLLLHPSCSHLSAAVKFFNARGEQEKAKNAEQQLAHCGAESLAYPETLSAAGRHAEAADYLEKLVTENPLNRAARRMLVRQLLLDGQEERAKQQAAKLHAIAPNSLSFARLALAPYQVLDSSSGRAAGFPQHNQFYVPYHRDGLQLIRQSAQRLFSGGPSVLLLNDKVVSLTAEGSLSIYTHRITRLLNKDGISRFGEVSIPPGADLLELRTIKAAGQIIEPELTLEKSSISMPALEPGDSIEEEFVVHYPNWDEAPDDAAEFTFGSFIAPILLSRFVVIAPENVALDVARHNAGAPRLEHAQGNLFQIWERNDIAQTAWEPNLPPENQLAGIIIRPAEDLPALLREEAIAATRIGLETEQTAQSFRNPLQSDFEKARRLYRFVTAKIEASASDWSANTAEETLRNSRGSRTAALLALSRSIGLKAELVLARQVAGPCLTSSNCYTQPLVRFYFANGNVVDTDAESADLPFGALSATLNHEDALLVSTEHDTADVRVRLSPATENATTTAEADLFLDETGSASVNLRVMLNVERGRQIRALLRRSNARERQIFFDEMATRIFPAATQVRGSSEHEDDPEKPLELTLRCRLPQIVNPNGPWDLDQLVPGLGLRDLYARSAARNLPLYVDSPLVESSSFHMYLPSNFQVRSLPSDFTAHNQFGDYSAQFVSAGQQITIHRQFRIPVQIVSQPDYAAFSAFAREIDDAERGRIMLQPSFAKREPVSASESSR